MPLNEYPMPPLRPEVERDGYGRYMLPNPEDPGRIKSYTRATTLSKAISDTYNLDQWSKRMITQGFAAKPELLAAIDLTLDDRELRGPLQDTAEAAFEASGATVARERGTQLHYYTEAVDGGHLTIEQVPAEYRREVKAYVDVMAKAGIKIPTEAIERVLLNVVANVVGTADRQHVIMPNGTKVLADVKTGKDLSYSWPEIAMQLGIYAKADAMLEYDADGDPYWDGVPEVDQRVALVMHVPVDQAKCTLWLVDIEKGWAAVELAHEVREYRKSGRTLAVHFDAKAWGATEAPADSGVYAGMSMRRVAAGTPEHTEALRLVTELPESAQDGEVRQFAPIPSDTAGFGTDAEAQALELTPMDEARREYDRTKAEIENLKAGWPKGKRRTKAMITAERADDEAFTDPDGVHTPESYGILTRQLRRAFKLDVVPNTAPPPTSDKAPAEIAPGVFTSEAVPAGTTVFGNAESLFGAVPQDPATALPPVPEPMPVPEAAPVTTKYGTPVSKGDPRLIECTESIDRAEPTAEAMAQVYAEYADVWDASFHTGRAEARISDATARAALDAAPPVPEVDPAMARLHSIAAALDACTTAEDMGKVYEANADVWTDEMTAYGQAVLARAV
jgi:hypothetical protein